MKFQLILLLCLISSIVSIEREPRDAKPRRARGYKPKVVSTQNNVNNARISSKNDPLKWGIMGAGKISNDFVAITKSMPQHQFVAVGSRRLSSAQDFANRHNVSKAYGSYLELANDPEVQVVYIGTVNNVHLDNVRLMLEHGKHLLVEKPLAMNSKQVEEMVSLAKSKRLFFMEALVERFTPSFDFAFEHIRRGTIGNVYHVNGGLGYRMVMEDRVSTRELGGGTVLDLGIYAIGLADSAYDGEMPSKIEAIGNLNQNGVDLNFSANLKYGGNRTASIFANGLLKLPNDAFIIGTNGTIRIAGNFKSSERVYINDVVHDFPFPKTDEHLFYAPDSLALRYEAEEVRKCINEGRIESQKMSHKDSIVMAKIEDEIRRQIGVVYDVD
ncbi:trans-1,2-dihydrobenzene-1,2-diol dehydrogenase-like isoform X2 [Oppia nitens]|uniref:trans-1,2-dihydrobenzene-1,2-diol dehydrogenase-like isoform X2 n=1 Tax=Oppia nitens TaxID=1686743 RepID=UPI0023DB48B4|nr:trans-1,2-dihydrobenzene-1,2-diol dehydrogenase-like isoform X2 [Oppia nitens]